MIFFSFVCKRSLHKKKEKRDTFGIWPTERARVLHSAIYSTLNGFLGFGGGEKTKKRCGGAAGRRGDGGEVEPGRGMAAGRVGMTAAGGWWCAGGPGGVIWCNDNQSM